jgi:hypothetical protein
MAVTKSSNGVSGGERRRKPRASAAATRASESAWLGRVDALADRLAALDDRDGIIEQVVSETLSLLPADSVVVRTEATSVAEPLFTEENEGAPARAWVPVMIGARHFGAVEIAMKPGRALTPGERTLSVALARQCALALDGLALRKAQRELIAEATAAAASAAASDLTSEATAEGVSDVTPGTTTSAALRIVTAGEVVAPIVVVAGSGASMSDDPTAVQAAFGRLEGDLRALAKLARSAELPPTSWVDQAERKALRRVDELRMQILGPVDPS